MKLGDRGKRILGAVTRFNNISKLTTKVSLFLCLHRPGTVVDLVHPLVLLAIMTFLPHNLWTWIQILLYLVFFEFFWLWCGFVAKMKKEVGREREEVGLRSDGGGDGDGHHLGDGDVDLQAALLPDIGVCKGGEGHLLHKREVVREGENEEKEEVDKGGRKEEKSEGEGEKEENDCKTFLWLGEPAPPPPKARLLSSKFTSHNLHFLIFSIILAGF